MRKHDSTDKERMRKHDSTDKERNFPFLLNHRPLRNCLILGCPHIRFYVFTHSIVALAR
jgi:hypothetical protein